MQTKEAKTTNANDWMNVDAVCREAKAQAIKHGLPAFVYQTGADRFNYRFISEDSSLGVLVARFDASGRSV